MFIDNVIPLIGSYFASGVFQYFILPVLCLAIIATIPCIIRSVVNFR